VASTWGGNRFDNARIKSLGWRQLVPTDEGLRRAFEWLRAQSG
jgi:nucleoside-diphosphate-sugar epimerase